ncbi:MAG: hypothetical protein AAF483_30540 [Planctomycetota bacterium]
MKEYTVEELGARVIVKCPKDQQRMYYAGRKKRPWYLGHAVSNLLLLLVLFAVMVYWAGNLDETEAKVICGAAVSLVFFEIGRLASSTELTNRWLPVGTLRLIVFFSTTIILMSLFQTKIEWQEKAMLGVLLFIATAWELVPRIVHWFKVGAMLKSLANEIWKSLAVSAVLGLFAFDLDGVGEKVTAARDFAFKEIVVVGEGIRTAFGKKDEHKSKEGAKGKDGDASNLTEDENTDRQSEDGDLGNPAENAEQPQASDGTAGEAGTADAGN